MVMASSVLRLAGGPFQSYRAEEGLLDYGCSNHHQEPKPERSGEDLIARGEGRVRVQVNTGTITAK